MESTIQTTTKTTLQVTLIAALIQGLALYSLHHAIQANHWPAPKSDWLAALYTLACFVPTTVQLLAAHVRSAVLWIFVAVIAGTFSYFGWYNAAILYDDAFGNKSADGLVSFALLLTILWLLMLPFVQSRLLSGRWLAPYDLLFAIAWRNKILLAQATAFTLMLWLLLFLWERLFHMLGIDFFSDLFGKPVFIYLVTTLTFGCALHLIGSIERLTSALIEQTLNTLKWLAPVAGFILTIFTIALAIKLPSVMSSGQSAISADWLLGLIATFVALLNAAYRDGTVNQPYPTWIARALRWTVPLTAIIALTAIYALVVRTQHYGLTVQRIWAFVVAGAAMAYAIGYSIAAFSRTGWLAGVSRVNVFTAIALIATLAATLSPVFSPYRFAAYSQFQQVLNQTVINEGRNDTPLNYLRFNAGIYGLEKLQELTQVQDHPNASRIRTAAQQALAQKNPWESAPAVDPAARIASLPVYPSGRVLNGPMRESLLADLSDKELSYRYSDLEGAVIVFADLNNDAADEFILLTAKTGFVYQNSEGQWQEVAQLRQSTSTASWQSVVADLQQGQLNVTLPKWRNLTIGKQVYTLLPD